MATKKAARPIRAAGRRQPRPDPRARRAGEQPQGRQHRAPEAPADGVHRRVRLGQELAGVRHDRRGVAAADQRDLQRLRAGLHADAVAAGGRRPGGPDDGDHRRPGADGLQPPLHGRHRHRRQRDAADPLQPDREAAHRPAHRLLVQRPDADGERGDDGRQGRGPADRRPQRRLPGRHVPALRGHGLGQRLRPDRDLRRVEVARRGRPPRPGLQHGRLVRPNLQRRRSPDGQADREVHQEGAAEAPLRRAGEDQGRGRQPHLRGRPHQGPEVDADQGSRCDAAACASVRRAGGHVHHLSRLRRHPAQRRSPLLEDRREEHRRRLLVADQRPGRVGARPRRARRSPRWSPGCNISSTRSRRSGSGTSRSTGRRAPSREARRSARR